MHTKHSGCFHLLKSIYLNFIIYIIWSELILDINTTRTFWVFFSAPELSSFWVLILLEFHSRYEFDQTFIIYIYFMTTCI